VERQQIKWLALAGLLVGVEMSFLALDPLLDLLPGTSPLEGTDAGSYVIGDGLFTVAVTLVPVAMGLAIARYRLYDVDRLISRTLAYGALAVIIVAVYVLGVTAVGSAIAGGRMTTALGLAVTVAVVLAFHPLRGWLETRADRLVFGARPAPYDLVTRFERELLHPCQPAADDADPHQVASEQDPRGFRAVPVDGWLCRHCRWTH
jgi:hypothetical protein